MYIKLFLLTLLVSLTLTQASLHRKQLAGPPDTFQMHSIWGDVTTSSYSALMNMHMIRQVYSDESDEFVGKIFGEVTLSVDATKNFEFVFGSPLADKMSLILKSESGNVIDLNGKSSKSSIPVGSTGESVPVDYYLLDMPETGMYTLTVVLNEELATEEEVRTIMTNTVSDAFVLFENQDDMHIEAKLLSPVICSSGKVGLTAKIVPGRELSETNSVITITDAYMNILTPSGQEIEVDMNDDGILGDEVAGDDSYSGSVTLNEVGDYQFEAILSGFKEDGDSKKPFTKTVQYLIPSAEGKVNFAGSASLSVKDSTRALVHLAMELSPDTTESDLPNYRAYTEVYGHSSKSGAVVPVAWIGAIVNIIESDISLELDLGWLNMAQVEGPLLLQNTYIVNLQTETVVAAFKGEIPVSNSKIGEIPEFRSNLGLEVTEITEEMRVGVLPPVDPELKSSETTLILVHGYCSSNNPFPKEDFTNAAFFLNANANIPTDEFAQKVDAFAKAQGATKYSIVGHSQGGMVALHLLNYYATGLDYVKGGRKIQTVGTPWQGCTGAGSIANLGKVFGVTCGENKDLTKNGASVWLSGITKESRKEVYYYTTTYKQGKLFGDSCNTAVNLILKWPNDGTSELALSSLEDGKNMGNKEAQCHTTGMNYPAQYLDAGRNAEMNSKAARD